MKPRKPVKPTSCGSARLFTALAIVYHSRH